MRPRWVLTVAVGVALLLGAASAATSYPEVIVLPRGFQPEGIAIGRGNTFYVGSIPTGAIYRGDLRTGKGRILVRPASGRQALGLEVDGRERVFVAGGPTGQAYVYDGRSGARLASYRLARGETFVNDVVVTRDAAFFTDSFRPFVYRVPIGRNGTLGKQAQVQRIRLSGDISYRSGFNANGIDAEGKTLLIAHSNDGALFRVNASTGATDRIELTGRDLSAPDGILLVGRRLYIVQNALDQVAVVALAPGLGSGQLVKTITSPYLDVPTTIDELGNRLYAVNARFGVADATTAEYAVVQLRK